MKKIVIFLLVACLLAGCSQDTVLPSTDTFYATILSINGNALVVEGLAVNDINARGQFHIKVDENTRLDWLGTQITLSELDVGDRIAITWSGPVQETSPAVIVDPVHRIKLLEDEKGP